MKLGILGPIGGTVLAIIILSAFVANTETDSLARCGGILVATAIFAGAIALGIHGEKDRT